MFFLVKIEMDEKEPIETKPLEIVEPIGKRVLIRKDEDKKQTKGGIQLPDNIEIPTITDRKFTGHPIAAVRQSAIQSQRSYPSRFRRRQPAFRRGYRERRRSL